MRKLFFALALALATGMATLSAQTVNIPDANFKACLIGNTAINANEDTEIQVSEAAAFTGSINCNNLNISDLTGIEAFTELTSLFVANNNLTTLNVSANTLLTNLTCPNNQLTSLDVSANINLQNLNCSNNLIASINVNSNAALEGVSIQGTQIASLDLSNNDLLHSVFCQFNPNLESLNVKNGNNSNFIDFYATDCPNLSCIEVDNAAYSTTNWTNIDATASFSENCSGATSVDESFNNVSFAVFPNPANEFATLSNLPNNSAISIIDIAGKVVHSSVLANEQEATVDTRDFPNGIYLIRIDNTENSANKRLVVAK